jgi:methyl-accepting chemotaxis protein
MGFISDTIDNTTDAIGKISPIDIDKTVGGAVDKATDTIGKVSPVDLDKTAGDLVEDATGNGNLADKVRNAGETIDNSVKNAGEILDENGKTAQEVSNEIVDKGEEVVEDVKDEVNEFTGGAVDITSEAWNGLGNTVDTVVEKTERAVKNPNAGGSAIKGFISNNKEALIVTGVGTVGAYILNEKVKP